MNSSGRATGNIKSHTLRPLGTSRWHRVDISAEPQYRNHGIEQLHPMSPLCNYTYTRPIVSSTTDILRMQHVMLPQLPGDPTLGYLHLCDGKISAANQLRCKTGKSFPCGSKLRHFIYAEIRERFRVIWGKAKITPKAYVCLSAAQFSSSAIFKKQHVPTFCSM